MLTGCLTFRGVESMIIVMPLGYGAPGILSPASRAFRDASLVERMMDRFHPALLPEVIPRIEKTY
jgi:hypothetical protein